MIKKSLLFITTFCVVYYGSWHFWGESLLFEAGMEVIRKEIEKDEYDFYGKVIKDKHIVIISRKRISPKQLKIVPHEYHTQIPGLKMETIIDKEQADNFYETVARKIPWGGDSTKLVGLEIIINKNNGILGTLNLLLIPYSDTSNGCLFIWAIFTWIPIRLFG